MHLTVACQCWIGICLTPSVASAWICQEHSFAYYFWATGASHYQAHKGTSLRLGARDKQQCTGMSNLPAEAVTLSVRTVHVILYRHMCITYTLRVMFRLYDFGDVWEIMRRLYVYFWDKTECMYIHIRAAYFGCTCAYCMAYMRGMLLQLFMYTWTSTYTCMYKYTYIFDLHTT
jgi:hypothetical protein